MTKEMARMFQWTYLKCLTSSWLVTLPPFASINCRTDSSENSVGPAIVHTKISRKHTMQKWKFEEELIEQK